MKKAPFVTRPSAKEVRNLRLDYLFPGLRSESKPLRIGELQDADSVIGWAFSRWKITDEELCSTIADVRSKAGMDYNRAFALLNSMNFDAGDANRLLAKKIVMLVEETDGLFGNGAPIVMMLQWEIVAALREVSNNFYRQRVHYIRPLWPPLEGENFQTNHVAEQAKKIMDSQGLYHPIAVAAGPMLPRAVAVAWKFGINPIVMPVLVGLIDPENKTFENVPDKLSAQPYIQSYLHYWAREMFGRYVHHPLKKLVSLSPPERAPY
jgi:hypothetical protein